MNHLSTSKFICEILSYNITNYTIKSYKNVDWDRVVKITSNHLSIPALYYRLKERKLTKIVPKDLLNYFREIYNQNKSRNIKILKQIDFLNTLLLKNNINFCFLKGAAVICSKLYSNTKIRMLGDLDILVSKEDHKKTIKLLSDNEFNNKFNNYVENNQRHYPRLVNNKYICAIEIHNRCFTNKKHLKTENILKNKIFINTYPILSYQDMILHNALNYQINDNANLYGTYGIKNMFESLQIIKKLDKKTLKHINENNHLNINFAINNLFLKEFKYKNTILSNLQRLRLLLFLKFKILFKIQNIIFSIFRIPKLYFRRIYDLTFSKSYRLEKRNSIINKKNIASWIKKEIKQLLRDINRDLI